MRWTDEAWREPAGWYDLVWGLIIAVLVIAGVIFLFKGQEGIYRMALWIGGAR